MFSLVSLHPDFQAQALINVLCLLKWNEKEFPPSFQAWNPVSEGPQMQQCGPGAMGEESLSQDLQGLQTGQALLSKEMLCFDFSERPQPVHWGGGPRWSWCGSPLQWFPVLPATPRALLIGEPLFLVHCVAHRVLGTMGRVGSSHSFHRA